MESFKSKMKKKWRNVRIIEMRALGYTYRAIAYNFGLSVTGIAGIIQHQWSLYKRCEYGNVGRKSCFGTYGKDVRLIIKTKRESGITYQEIGCELCMSRQRAHQLGKGRKNREKRGGAYTG